ncbi:hypothetical protein FRC00_001158 [Tulasnella sp. 408]|nr:hypothetical protein FRC00_001158 [Tulasnella sp. 408]
MLDESSKVAVKQLRIIQGKGIRVRVAMRLARELKVWAKAKHSNVLRLVGYYLSENYGCAQLVSPYMGNGNITEYMKRTRSGIETRLAFANVLISDQPDAVLCDFGLATFVENSAEPSGLTTSRSIKGSLRYMSPELFEDDEAKHTLESDIWAWACTIFEPSVDSYAIRRQILTDAIPYATSRSDGSLMAAVARGISPGTMDLLDGLAKVHPPSHSTLTALQTLIPECWNIDPKKRPHSLSILERFNYVDRGDSALPPAQPQRDEKRNSDSALAQPATVQPSGRSRNRIVKRDYSKILLKSRRAYGWVTEAAPELEVLQLNEPLSKGELSAAPNGKWMAISFSDGTSNVWNLENMSTMQIGFPHSRGYRRFRWSQDGRQLAYFGADGLEIWSTENTKSGQSQMGSDLTSRDDRPGIYMVTIPVDRVGGQR